MTWSALSLLCPLGNALLFHHHGDWMLPGQPTRCGEGCFLFVVHLNTVEGPLPIVHYCPSGLRDPYEGWVPLETMFTAPLQPCSAQDSLPLQQA